MGELSIVNFGSFTRQVAISFIPNIATIMNPGKDKGDGVASTVH